MGQGGMFRAGFRACPYHRAGKAQYGLGGFRGSPRERWDVALSNRGNGVSWGLDPLLQLRVLSQEWEKKKSSWFLTPLPGPRFLQLSSWWVKKPGGWAGGGSCLYFGELWWFGSSDKDLNIFLIFFFFFLRHSARKYRNISRNSVQLIERD